MPRQSYPYRKPSIYVTEADYDRLSNLARSRATLGAALLEDELARATVVKDGEFPRNFVRLGSFVSFRDLTSGRVRRVQVVLPEEADIDLDRLSVVTPVGAALIGLKVGDSMGLSTEDGRPHVLVVEAVERIHASA
jgi:regulator of nucleoside diphosphate kinase